MGRGVLDTTGRGSGVGVVFDDSPGVRPGGGGAGDGVCGKGGTGGRPSATMTSPGGGPRVREILRWRRGEVGGTTGGASASSSASVRTASSLAVSVPPPPATRERRFGCPTFMPDRSRGAPVILEMLYVEKRFDARRSSTSLFFSAARELATPGFAVRVSTAGSSGGGDIVWTRSGSDRLWGNDSSMTTEGGCIGLSTSE